MKIRLSKLIFLLLVLLIVGDDQVLTQSVNVYGTFLHCEFVCTAIKINPDFTFEYLLDGDLFNNQITNGTWKFIDKNKIKAESPKPSGILRVKETIANRSNFLIIVTDFVGAVIPATEVSIDVKGEKINCHTNENGECEISKVKKFDIAFSNYRGTYKVINLNANEFTVELSNEQIGIINIDDVWLIEGNRLYLENQGKINNNYYLKRVSRKKERKLFPK